MAGGKDSKTAQAVDPDYFEVLVGWASDDYGDRLLLRMQGARKTPQSQDDIAEQRYLVPKDQAVLLANFLYRMSGHTAPEPGTPRWLRRLMGKP